MALTWPVLNQNQFTQSVTLGMLTQDPQPDTIPCQLNPSSVSGALCVGAAVKLLPFVGSNGQIIVDACTSASDGPVYGVIEYSKQRNFYVPGDQVNVAAEGNIIHLWSNAAITRGQRVSVTNPTAYASAPPAVQNDTTTGDYTIGVALGQAPAQNNFIRVQIRTAFNQATGVVTVSP